MHPAVGSWLTGGLDGGVDFDLHPEVRFDQGGYFNHRRHRPDVAEYLGVHRGDVAPSRDVGYVHASSHHVSHARAGVLKGGVDTTQRIAVSARLLTGTQDEHDGGIDGEDVGA